jgi:cytochrome c-type biogenesis protein CcmH/NrfG
VLLRQHTRICPHSVGFSPALAIPRGLRRFHFKEHSTVHPIANGELSFASVIGAWHRFRALFSEPLCAALPERVQLSGHNTMVKQRKQEIRAVQRPARRELPSHVVIAGAVCLAAGIAIGYYFGKQSSIPANAPTASRVTESIPNPSNFTKEEASLKSLVAVNPRDSHAMIHLGNLYYDHGRHSDAVEWYGKALEIDPNNVNVRTDRGTSLWNLGQADAALAEFGKSLEVNPTHPHTLYNMGVVYLNGKNNVEEARKAWQRLLASNPDYPERSRVEQQLATLSNRPSAPGSGPPGGAGQSGSVHDLLDRMKE